MIIYFQPYCLRCLYIIYLDTILSVSSLKNTLIIKQIFIDRLALKALERSPLLEGVEGNRIFTHNIQLLEENHYRLAGNVFHSRTSSYWL